MAIYHRHDPKIRPGRVYNFSVRYIFTSALDQQEQRQSGIIASTPSYCPDHCPVRSIYLSKESAGTLLARQFFPIHIKYPPYCLSSKEGTYYFPWAYL